MTVAIVGAGVAGLAAARDLVVAGAGVTVFEKSRGFGGRCATRRRDGFIWDTGATSIAPRRTSLGPLVEGTMPQDGLVEIELPVYVHRNLRIEAGDAGRQTRRFTYQTGISDLAKRMAEGIDVRLQCPVAELRRIGDRFEVEGEVFDALILTPPIPQTAMLLHGLRESRAIANIFYRPVISILLGIDAPTPETPYHALIDGEQRHPMTWLSLESRKSPGRAPEGHSTFVMQMSREYSRQLWSRPDEELVADAGGYLARLYGERYRVPVVSDVMRWKFAQPESPGQFSEANPLGDRLILAGDGLRGGRIEEAYESGREAAARLVAP